MGPRRTDAILAVVVTVSLAAIISLAQIDEGAPLRSLSFVFALGFGAVLLLRRGLPRTVVVLSILGTFAYYSLDLVPIGVALPVVAALFSVAEVGLTRFAVVSGAVVFLVSTAFRIRDDSLPLGRLLGAESISTIALIAAAIALGHAVATHRRFLDQHTQLLRLQDEHLRKESERQIQHERLQLSRDLHDTLGHKLSVISLHAAVGIEAIEQAGGEGSQAAEALDRVRAEAGESLVDLRSMVRVLRSGDETTRTRLGIEGIETLLEQARSMGISVSSTLGLSPGQVPSPVEAVIFRVVQEGITNVLRHASATAVSVEVGLNDDDVTITVADDGSGADSVATLGEESVEGHGLNGMSERVRLLGGQLSTRSAPGQGFTLHATLPRRLDS
ncbi:sensor histidine kinase [Brevibacterium zhoupengii]|uniref:sensor histidine kinase n=1 Tax=Brevibacterium zhoupengii TaxID=2898795 RepID=UPI001E37973E|nr:sensor histidine kinase [Brevibacterium zhoupengii]